MPSPSELARLVETVPPPSGVDDHKVWLAKARNANALNGTEIWWRWYQPWLEQRGYLLRPRYRPGWEPPARRGHAEREDCVEQTVRGDSFREESQFNAFSCFD